MQLVIHSSSVLTLLFICGLSFQGFAQSSFRTKNQEHFTKTLKSFEIVNPRISGQEEVTPLDDNINNVPSKLRVTFQAFGEDFLLDLRLNNDLVPRGFSLEIISHEQLSHRKSPRKCYYGGISRTHNESIVAISYCHGLLGIIRTDKETYFMEPMAKSDGSSFPHLVYRRSDMRARPSTGRSHLQASGECVAVKGPGRSRVNQTGHNLRGRRSVTIEATAQLLVVVDKDMIDFHGNDSIEEYALTVMNMVSEMYRYRSIGAAINIEVIRLILLYETPKGLTISSDGQRTLRSFCDWQNSLQWLKGSNSKEYLHYDAAVLLTRKDICADKSEPCATVGIGYLFGMCDPKRRCSVSEDNGLNVAFTVAHELGHNFGIFHDGDGNSCSDYSGDVPHLMSGRWMSRNVHGSMKWSQCSKDSFQRFLRSKYSDCLRYHSNSKTLVLPPDMPGVRYNADDQCRLQYGNRARHCHKYKAKLCQVLWCEIEGEALCRTKRNPPARGTACGPGKWCMYGSCVNNTLIPHRRDGGWSRWSDWSTCSRSCGSGVTILERKCDNPVPRNGGRYCVGGHKRYGLCNTKPCSVGSKDFRERQCAKFNNTKYKGEKHSWLPVISDSQPCELFCKPVNAEHRFSARLADKVTDGTPCAAGSRDICIDGRCQSVGCDHRIGSNARDDICGVCKGNSTTCYTVEGRFNQLAGKGYVEAALIPKGARNIRVTEVKPCTSFLALRSDLGTYYINGNWKIQLPGDFDAEGTIFKYIRSGTWERLVARGPTNTALHIMILYNGFNLGVKYQYTLPHNSSKTANGGKKFIKITGPTYGWVHGGWGPCSAHCGGGIRKSLKMRCVGFYRGKIRFVEGVSCKGATKPREEERVCNIHTCPVW